APDGRALQFAITPLAAEVPRERSDDFLFRIRDSTLRNRPGKLQFTRLFSLGELPAIEFLFDVPEPKGSLPSFAFLGERLYYPLSMMGSPEQVADADADRFLNSSQPEP